MPSPLGTSDLLDHSALPDIASAPLPAVYRAAKQAIKQCWEIDECRQWANKAEALASYARQSADDEMHDMALRIQVRAIDRCGELLREVKAGHNRFDRQDGEGPPNRKTAAEAAGLSERQRKTALRVNNVPREDFERLVEGDNPPSVTRLAKLGTVPRPAPEASDYLKGRNPIDFECATRLIGLIDYVLERGREITVEAAFRGLDAEERDELITALGKAIKWLTAIHQDLCDAV